VNFKHICGRHTIEGFDFIADNFKHWTRIMEVNGKFIKPSEVKKILEEAITKLKNSGDFPVASIGAQADTIVNVGGLKYTLGIEKLKNGVTIIGQFYQHGGKHLGPAQIKAMSEMF
jgi:hypothetical protein